MSPRWRPPLRRHPLRCSSNQSGWSSRINKRISTGIGASNGKIRNGVVRYRCLRLAFDQYDASHQQLAPPEPNAPLLLTAGTSAGTCAAAAHASVPAAPYDGLDAIVANSSICPSLIKQGKPLSQFLFICHTPVFPHLSRFSLPPFVALPCFPMCHAPVSAPSQYLPKRKHGCVGS